MRKMMLALAVAMIPATGTAEDTPPPAPLDEAVERVLGALRFVLRSIPQYEMPEVLPNGDIIIRRIPPEPDPEREPEPAPETAPDDDGTRI